MTMFSGIVQTTKLILFVVFLFEESVLKGLGESRRANENALNEIPHRVCATTSYHLLRYDFGGKPEKGDILAEHVLARFSSAMN